jgi:hypothetical protein
MKYAHIEKWNWVYYPSSQSPSVSLPQCPRIVCTYSSTESVVKHQHSRTTSHVEASQIPNSSMISNPLPANNPPPSPIHITPNHPDPFSCSSQLITEPPQVARARDKHDAGLALMPAAKRQGSTTWVCDVINGGATKRRDKDFLLPGCTYCTDFHGTDSGYSDAGAPGDLGANMYAPRPRFCAAESLDRSPHADSTPMRWRRGLRSPRQLRGLGLGIAFFWLELYLPSSSALGVRAHGIRGIAHVSRRLGSEGGGFHVDSFNLARTPS